MRSEIRFNLDSDLSRLLRPLHGKHTGLGKVSLRAGYLPMCCQGMRPDPGGKGRPWCRGQDLEEQGQVGRGSGVNYWEACRQSSFGKRG